MVHVKTLIHACLIPRAYILQPVTWGKSSQNALGGIMDGKDEAAYVEIFCFFILASGVSL